jgi:hypothetical protein
VALISSSVAAKDFNFHSFSPVMTDDCSYFNTKEVEAKDKDGKIIVGKKDNVTNFMSPTAHTLVAGGMSVAAVASIGVFVYQYNQFLIDNEYAMTTESLVEFVNQSALAKVLVATGVISTSWLTVKGITTLGQHFDFFMTDALVNAKLAEAKKLPTTEVAEVKEVKDANGVVTTSAVKAVTKEQAAKNKARIAALQKIVDARPAKVTAVEAPKAEAAKPAAATTVANPAAQPEATTVAPAATPAPAQPAATPAPAPAPVAEQPAVAEQAEAAAA